MTSEPHDKGKTFAPQLAGLLIMQQEDKTSNQEQEEQQEKSKPMLGALDLPCPMVA